MQNLGREWGPQAWKQMMNTSPNKVFTDSAQHSAKTEEEKQQTRQRNSTEKASAIRSMTQLQLTKRIADMM